jgi:hypothetical protein
VLGCDLPLLLSSPQRANTHKKERNREEDGVSYVLQEPKDEVDGLHHHLLHPLLSSECRHGDETVGRSTLALLLSFLSHTHTP